MSYCMISPTAFGRGKRRLYKQHIVHCRRECYCLAVCAAAVTGWRAPKRRHKKSPFMQKLLVSPFLHHHPSWGWALQDPNYFPHQGRGFLFHQFGINHQAPASFTIFSIISIFNFARSSFVVPGSVIFITVSMFLIGHLRELDPGIRGSYFHQQTSITTLPSISISSNIININILYGSDHEILQRLFRVGFLRFVWNCVNGPPRCGRGVAASDKLFCHVCLSQTAKVPQLFFFICNAQFWQKVCFVFCFAL